MLKWHDIGHALVRRVAPLLLAALIGVLVDTRLLDGELGDALIRVVAP